ncbi:MAG: alkaline phosphatase family protein [Anaerolineales bacterium]|nr:alkaline phosphatase family protein [Anaerolineales bacterium]
MPDLTSSLLPRLFENRLAGLDLPEEYIYPAYAGQSILNIPHSICRWLGVPEFGEAPLIPEIHQAAGQDVQRVILILMDALALHRLQAWLAEGQAPVWSRLANQGLLAPLTSISPSTTSAALTTLWTGRSPSAHGIAGYELWLKEYGMVTNMILHAPMSFKGDVGSLSRAGFKPQDFLPLPTLGVHLKAHGVQTYAFQHYSIARSGLSQMFLADAEIRPFDTPADLWVSMRQLIESRPQQRQYIWSYWGHVDGLSHEYGPDDERVVAEFQHFSQAFEQYFLNRLNPGERKNTLLVLTADHGQIYTPLKLDQSLNQHPELRHYLHINPTGENRLTYLYLQPGSQQAVRDYVQTNWPDRFIFIDPAQALAAGLFGPSPQHPRLRERTGDLWLAARDDAYIWWSEKEDFLLGRHGGLHHQEMLVPLLMTRLD